MNILLVETNQKNVYPPLGLMKISTWHKRQGHKVTFIKDTPDRQLSLLGEPMPLLEGNTFDMIYITTLFTYHAPDVLSSVWYFKERYPDADIKIGGIFASLMPEYIKEKTGISPHIGVLPEVEECPPDYSLAPGIDYSLSYTTRGCPMKCAFCAVRKHEPTFYVKDNWQADIDPDKPKIIFWDNNWLASPNLEKDVEILRRLDKQVDFNQGLDCRYFDIDKARMLSTLKIKPLRFAFDNWSQDNQIQDAILVAKAYFNDIRVYILYNSPVEYDTPEFFYYRINEINKLGALSYPMRYRPIDSVDGRYISPEWGPDLLRGLKLVLMFYYKYGMIRKNRQAFKHIFGDSKEGFSRRLREIYELEKEVTDVIEILEV